MKKFNLAALSAVILTVAIVASCGKKSGDYRNALPADALMTFSYNPKSLIDKAAIGDVTQSPVYAALEKKLAEYNGMEAADREMILSIMADPAKSGLSMDHDIFMSMKMEGSQYNPQPTVVMLAKVKSRKELDALVAYIEKESGATRVNEDGITLVGEMTESMTVVLAYNDNMAIGYFAPEKAYSVTGPEIKKLFAQKKEEGLMGVEPAATAFSGNNDVCTVLSMGAALKISAPGVGSAAVPTLDMMKTAYCVMPANFEKGKIVSSMNYVFTDKDAEKQYLELTAKISGQVKGDLAKLVPANSMLAVVGRVNGAAMYEYMAAIPSYSTVMSMAPQVKTVMDALDGDIVLALTGLEFGSGMVIPRAALLAEMSNPGVLAEFAPMLTQAGATQTAEGEWTLTLQGITINFGVKGNMFYATNDATVMSALAGEKVESLGDRYGSVLAGSYGGFFGDLVAVRQALEAGIANGGIPAQAGMALPVVGMFENIEASSREPLRADMTLNMTDKEKNAADVIYHTVESLIQTAASMGAF